MLDDIFKISNDEAFNELALNIYHFQAQECQLYRQFHDFLGISHESITSINDIPFLPIEFFKTHTVISGKVVNSDTIFTSSGTTGQIVSKHHVSDITIYIDSFTKGFKYFYGNVHEYCILALLPNYYQRSGSSLVYMVNHLIKDSNNSRSGFFLDNIDELNNLILELEKKKQKTILIGVSYALLDLLEKYNYDLKSTIVMETGGMKGRRKELLKHELHQILKIGFGVEKIHSEYGMTEMLSQAYSLGDGIYSTPPWLKILIRDVNDPFNILGQNYSGGINIIDLANINSCSFIATQDLGRCIDNTSFEIIGRFDHSDVRGCNLMIE